jgi:hypothetical protein
MMEDRFLKRLRKKARKGLRGWPIATIAFYGPNLSQATKITVRFRDVLGQTEGGGIEHRKLPVQQINQL